MRISDWSSDVCSSDLLARGESMSETASFGSRDVDAREKAGMVRGVFSNVSSRYDLMNDALSGGMQRLWKNMYVSRLKLRNQEQTLDMAGRTCTNAIRLQLAGEGVHQGDSPEARRCG